MADKASLFPSAGTEDGFPGWYGFDGVTNKISVTYANSYDDYADQGIAISLDYRVLTAEEASGTGGGQVVNGVTMSFYEDSDFRIAQSPSFVAKNNVKKELYVSLSANRKHPEESMNPVPSVRSGCLRYRSAISAKNMFGRHR